MNVLKHQKKISYAILSAIFFLSALSLMLFSNNIRTPKVEANSKWTDNGIMASTFSGGSGTLRNPYLISTAAQLGMVASYSNNGTATGGKPEDAFKAKHYRLSASIDLSAHTWVSIGTASHKFSGTFDGGGKNIYGLNGSGGLFGVVEGATIQNLFLHATITNNTTSATVGGLVDTSYGKTTIKKINTNVEMSGSGKYVGGLVGISNGNITIEESLVNAKLSYSSSYQSSSYIGGVMGYSSVEKVTLKNLSTYGNISSPGHQYVGGTFGYLKTTNSSSIIENIINNANVSGNTSYSVIGGIFGVLSVRSQAEKLINNGNVSSGNSLGGVTGSAWAVIKNSYNIGSVTGTSSSSQAGGIAGYSSKLEMNNVFNSGEITSISNAGGIVASVLDSILKVTNATNIGKVTSSSGVAGGILGAAYRTELIISFAFNTAKIKGNERVGGIAGYIEASPDVLQNEISYAFNQGDVEAKGSFVGGIVGVIEGNLNNKNVRQGTRFELLDSLNIGKISGKEYKGGIAGYLFGKKGKTNGRYNSLFCGNYNAGQITSIDNTIYKVYVGSIIGRNHTDNSEISGSGYLKNSFSATNRALGTSNGKGANSKILNSDPKIFNTLHGSVTLSVDSKKWQARLATNDNNAFFETSGSILGNPLGIPWIYSPSRDYANNAATGYIDSLFPTDVWGNSSSIQGGLYLKNFYWYA